MLFVSKCTETFAEEDPRAAFSVVLAGIESALATADAMKMVRTMGGRSLMRYVNTGERTEANRGAIWVWGGLTASGA